MNSCNYQIPKVANITPHMFIQQNGIKLKISGQQKENGGIRYWAEMPNVRYEAAYGILMTPHTVKPYNSWEEAAWKCILDLCGRKIFIGESVIFRVCISLANLFPLHLHFKCIEVPFFKKGEYNSKQIVLIKNKNPNE